MSRCAVLSKKAKYPIRWKNNDTTKILENLEDYTELGNKPTRDIDISGISFDTRNLEKGDLFVAIKGIDADGHKYINKAIEKGASAVLFEDETHKLQDKNIPFIKARNSREALARIAAAFYGFPARKLKIIGVTGTDGKTTTSTLIHHILNETGHKAGLITSINVIIGDRVFQTGFIQRHPTHFQFKNIWQKWLLQELNMP